METTEVEVDEMGETERSLGAQEMICGVMISSAKAKLAVPQCNNHNASVTHHVNL